MSQAHSKCLGAAVEPTNSNSSSNYGNSGGIHSGSSSGGGDGGINGGSRCSGESSSGVASVEVGTGAVALVSRGF